MANQDWGFGLVPKNDPGGQTPETLELPLKQAIQSTTPYQTKIYKGSVILWNTTVGCVKMGSTASDFAANVIGVAAEYYAGSTTDHLPTHIKAWMPKPGQRFLISSDGGTGSLTEANYLFKNFEAINVTSGNTSSGNSSMELDYSTGSLTATDHYLKCVGLSYLAPADKGSSHVVCEVEWTHGLAWPTDVTIT